MINKLKYDARFRVLFLTVFTLLLIGISSIVLNIKYKNKDLLPNKNYIVGKDIDTGDYMYEQKDGTKQSKITFKKVINENKFVQELNSDFLKTFDIKKDTNEISVDYNSKKYQDFLEKDHKFSLMSQVKQLSFLHKKKIALNYSYHNQIKGSNLIDNISLSNNDEIKTELSTTLKNRYAPTTLFLDNIVNAMIWVTFQAGVVVPLSMFIINYTFYLTRFGFTRYMRRNRIVQLLLSSSLGAMPGDATTLVLFPFYFNKIITWGSLVALSFTAIGDSGFILMSNKFNIFGKMGSGPNMFITVILIKVIIGFLVGLILVLFKVDPKIKADADKKVKKPVKNQITIEDLEEMEMSHDSDKTVKIDHISYLENSDIDRALHHNKSTILRKPSKFNLFMKTHVLWIAFWVIELVKYAIFFAEGANVADETNSPLLKMMSIVTALLVIVYWFFMSMYNSDEMAEVESNKTSFKQTLVHSTESSVKIMFRVIVIMSIYKIVVFGLIGNSNVEHFFSSFDSWWMLTILGVIVGIIPGCQLQIAFQTVAISLGWPLPAVLANATSQIGDSAFSFITVSKKAWFRLQTYNALIALAISLIVGYLMYGHF